jgi:preprotein translocase subunit YajC
MRAFDLSGVFNMSFSLISNAYADGAAPAAQQDGGSMMFLTFFLVVAFFFMMWSQQKRTKQQKAMVDALQKGDEIATIGGMLGRIDKVEENHLNIEIADKVVVQIQRSAVQTVLPKGTIK